MLWWFLLTICWIPKDSIGQVIQNDTLFVLYKVEPGETIFRISQKYDVSTLAIKEANGLTSYDIEVGQVLKIPRKRVVEAIPIRHTLQKGDNLYALSKQYNVSIKQIIEWNELEDFTLPEGKKLIVGYDTLRINTEKNTSSMQLDTLLTNNKPPEKLAKLPPSAFAYPNFDFKKNKKFYEVSEIGMVVVTENPVINHLKLECLHDVLPVGSIVEITYLSTGRSVFAKVVGKKGNAQNILEVSQKVLNYLGVHGQKNLKTTIKYRWEE